MGEPSRRYLWILSRTPTMKETVYQEILARLPQEGYDPDLLRRTVQVDEAKENESGHSKETRKGRNGIMGLVLSVMRVG